MGEAMSAKIRVPEVLSPGDGDGDGSVSGSVSGGAAPKMPRGFEEDTRRELLAKGCVNVLRSCEISRDVAAEGAMSSNIQFCGKRHLPDKLWGDDGSEHVDNFQWNGSPLSSEVLSPEERREALVQYKDGKLCGKKQRENKISADSNSDPAVAWVENESSSGYGTPSEKWPEAISNPPHQAKRANVACWACVNFSCLRRGKLHRFLSSLVTTCVDSGTDLSMEPTMLVPASDPCATDIEDILWNVRRFFYHHDVGTGQTRFLLVILPDGTRADARIEDFCKDIGVVYHFCSPLYETFSDRMAKEEYMKNVANEIKARVMECNILSDTYEDLNIDEVAEYYSFDEEMREDGYSYKEMGEDYGYNYKEMESVQLSSSHNESGKYSSEEMNPEASHISGPPGTEEGEQQLLPAEGFTTIADAIPQAKSANIKPCVCLNFSRISGKESLKFVSKLGTLCVSIGMKDLKPEPTMMFRISASHDTDVGTTLWTVFKFFDHYEIGKGEKLVLVILPEARYSDADIKRACGNLGLVCQFCLPWYARRASEEYLKNAANKIKTKVLQCNTASESCGDMIDSDPEEFSGSDGEMGEDGSQQSEDSAPEMDTHLYSSDNESGEHCIPEKLSGSDKETGGEAAFACGREFHY